MNLYRNKENKKLYIIEQCFRDINHLNHNEFSGIDAYPYEHDGNIISHHKGYCKYIDIEFNPEKFVEDNFEKVSEIFNS